MSAKHSDNTCLGLLKKFKTYPSANEKILEGADNFQKPANIPAVIDELGKGHFESIQNYAEQSILKPLSDSQDKFLVLVHQDEAAFSEVNVLFVLSALSYDKGDTACLKEIADQYQHHDGVGHLMNNLGVMLSERMDYKRSETCFKAAKRCFEQQHDHLRSGIASLNLAFLHKLFGNYKSALSCCNAAAVLCHDISMRTTKDVNLPWKVLRRVAGLCQELGNYKKYEEVLRIGVLYDISGTNECSTGNLTKQLMTLQLKEQNGEKIEAEELKHLESHLFELMDCSHTNNLPKPELINTDFITIVIIAAKMFRDIGHLEEACKLLEKLQTTFLLVHGGKCSLYGTLLYQIGSFKLGTGETSEAVHSLKQAEKVFSYYFGKNHYMVASCKMLLGACALLKEDIREASTYLNNALTLFKKLNHHHPKIAKIHLNFALLYSQETKFESAQTTLEEALNIITLACGEVSPEMASAYIQAAAILQKVEKFRALAVDKVKKAIDIFIQLGLQCDHPDITACHNLLGVLQLSLGQSKDAEEQFTKVQQQVPLQDDPCLTTRVIAPERSNMFFQARNDCGTGRFMGPCFGAQVVSLVNLVDMKKGEERKNHLNTMLCCLQGHDTEEPLVWDFAGQIVYYISHRVCSSDSFVYFILTSASSSDFFESDQGMNSEEPYVFLLSSSNGHAKNPGFLVFWKTSKVLEKTQLNNLNSAFRENVDMLFLQPKFRKAYLEGQDLYVELSLPHDLCAALALCSKLDFLPLVIEQELSDSPKKSVSFNSVVPTSLVSPVKPSAHVSYFSCRLRSHHQAVLVFGNLVLSLGQSLALTKVEGIEISSAPSLQSGTFFLFQGQSNSSLSVVVEKETVHVKCRTVKESESTCICSLVRNTLESTMESLCHVVELKFELSVLLPCDGIGGDYMRERANCSCGCNGFQSEPINPDNSLETLDFHAHVRSQEPESDHQDVKPSADVLQNEVKLTIMTL